MDRTIHTFWYLELIWTVRSIYSGILSYTWTARSILSGMLTYMDRTVHIMFVIWSYLYKNPRSFLQPVWGVGSSRGLGAGATWLEKTRKNSIKRCAGVLGSHLGARDRCAGVFRSHWGARERLRRRARGPLWRREPCWRSKALHRPAWAAQACLGAGWMVKNTLERYRENLTGKLDNAWENISKNFSGNLSRFRCHFAAPLHSGHFPPRLGYSWVHTRIHATCA